MKHGEGGGSSCEAVRRKYCQAEGAGMTGNAAILEIVTRSWKPR
jgi:hypothetical protein